MQPKMGKLDIDYQVRRGPGAAPPACLPVLPACPEHQPALSVAPAAALLACGLLRPAARARELCLAKQLRGRGVGGMERSSSGNGCIAPGPDQPVRLPRRRRRRCCTTPSSNTRPSPSWGAWGTCTTRARSLRRALPTRGRVRDGNQARCRAAWRRSRLAEQRAWRAQGARAFQPVLLRAKQLHHRASEAVPAGMCWAGMRAYACSTSADASLGTGASRLAVSCPGLPQLAPCTLPCHPAPHCRCAEPGAAGGARHGRGVAAALAHQHAGAALCPHAPRCPATAALPSWPARGWAKHEAAPAHTVAAPNPKQLPPRRPPPCHSGTARPPATPRSRCRA